MSKVNSFDGMKGGGERGQDKNTHRRIDLTLHKQTVRGPQAIGIALTIPVAVVAQLLNTNVQALCKRMGRPRKRSHRCPSRRCVEDGKANVELKLPRDGEVCLPSREVAHNGVALVA